jgi:DNA repair exonuclease SbcCD ATPase subunit
MAKLTKEEKEIQRKAQAEKEAVELKEFQEKVLPLKILELMARTNNFGGVYANVKKEDGELSVEFTFPSTQDDYRVERVLTLKSEPYEVDQVDYEFQALEERMEKARKKLKTAQEVYDSLSQEQRDAIGLKARPY